MKTESLIDLLAQGAGPAPKAVVARRLVPASVLGLAASVLLALVVIGPIPASMYATPAPWIKLGYGIALVAAAAWLTARLARPVARLQAPGSAVIAVLLAMLTLGAVVLLAAPAEERPSVLWGHSWRTCPRNVALLSLPGLAGLVWALRGLAPTRPRWAGAAAGLLAGALGAVGYSLACTEASMTFVALWYTLGILISAGLGAWLGPRLLRW